MTREQQIRRLRQPIFTDAELELVRVLAWEKYSEILDKRKKEGFIDTGEFSLLRRDTFQSIYLKLVRNQP